MLSGPIVVSVLEKENAVKDYRTLIGATNPAEAAEGTIRKDFALSQRENSVHGSDSVESAKREIAYFLRRFRNPTVIHFYKKALSEYLSAFIFIAFQFFEIVFFQRINLSTNMKGFRQIFPHLIRLAFSPTANNFALF